MMKFKLLFKKGHNNPSTKSTDPNQHVPSASSTTTATISNAGAAASAARSHFEHEKHSKQNKNKTSVKKVLNSFHEESVENPKKNLNKIVQNSREKIFLNDKTTTSVQTKECATESAVPYTNNEENNLKKNVNKSTSVCNKKHFDNVYPDKTDEHSNNNVPIPCDNKSTELNVCPGDKKEKSSASKLEPNNSHRNPESEIRLGTVSASGHALIGHSLKIMEYQDLKQQLDSVSNEKQMLETKINELLNYQESLRDELCKMKDIQDSGGGGATSSSELGTGGGEGGDSIHILSRSPLSDTPPHPLPLPSTSPPRHATSAPPSIGDVSGTGGLLLDTPDWDKHSSSSLSEISVACLQDRITQMEETHYCTNEELQATLQELADLQNQLIDLQHTNETLGHEKSVLLESLCRQTEKLEDTRTKAETLQELLLSRDESQQGSRLGVSEREGKLVELLKSAQLEKETLLGKHEESMSELSELRRLSNAMKQDTERLSERVRQLESTIDATHADKRQLDQQLGVVREEASSRTLEINRLKNLLDNARAKIEELEEDRANLRNKTELDELLDQTRREKDCLESQVAVLQDSMSRSECKTNQQEEIILRLKEEIKVIRNNAKSSLSDMEYERDLNQKEIGRLKHELELHQENYNELQVQVQNHLEDKRQLKSLLSETQKQLTETQQSLDLTSKRLTDESQLRSIENEEWQVFQRDLLTTVRVANDFKSETAQKLETTLIENKQLKERNRTLTSQLEKLKKVEADAAAASASVVKPVLSVPLGGVPHTPCSSSPSLLSYRSDNGAGGAGGAATTTSSVLTSVMQRNHFSREDSRLSVKSLIESIENATKQAKSGPSSSLSSSSSSLNSGSGGGGGGPCSPSSVLSPMEESHRGVQVPQSSSGGHHGILNSASSSNKKTNLNMLSSTPDIVHETLKPSPSTIIKSEEVAPSPASSAAAALLESMVRRNSQTDLSERKDPLQALVKNGGSRRNALLKWCQNKTLGYHNIDITNFSSSWNDGLALCAILHSYLPSKVPYDTLTPNEKRRNFTIAFSAAESVGIPTTLNTSDMITQERPDWNQVMAYVTSIYKHFET